MDQERQSKFQWNRLWLFLAMVGLTLYNHAVYKEMIRRFAESAEDALGWAEFFLIIATIVMGIRLVLSLTRNMKKGIKIVLVALSVVAMLVLRNELVIDDSYIELWLETPIVDVHLDGENSYFVAYTAKMDDEGIVFDNIDAEAAKDTDSYTTVKVKCLEEIAEYLIADKDVKYMFEARSFVRDPQNATLRYIDLVDYCDNRGK